MAWLCPVFNLHLGAPHLPTTPCSHVLSRAVWKAHPGDIGPFVRIAAFAAQREIIGCCRAAVFFRNNMIDLKWEKGNLG